MLGRNVFIQPSNENMIVIVFFDFRYEEFKIIENNTFVISFQLDSDKP